jgi:hypothetical protein
MTAGSRRQPAAHAHVHPHPHLEASALYEAEIEAERRGWYEIVALLRSLSPEGVSSRATTATPTGPSATWSPTSARGSPRPRSSSSG